MKRINWRSDKTTWTVEYKETLRIEKLESERRRRAKDPEKIRQYKSDWAAKNADKVKKQKDVYYAQNVQENVERIREWRKNHPEKKAAHKIVEWAIKTGRLIRPDFCSRCDGPKPQAHHEDYGKPLEIIWLCQSCHQRAHHPLKGVVKNG